MLLAGAERPLSGDFSTMKRTEQQLSCKAIGRTVHARIGKSLILTLTFGILALAPRCRAQSEDPSIDSAMNQQPSINSAIEVARAGSRAERANIISRAMNFNDKDAAAFWPIYRQYEYERTALEDGRVAVIKEYTEKGANLSDADAKSMAERMFEYDSRLAAIKKKYFKKFNRVLPAATVTKFFQVDRRIDLLADMNMESSLPPLARVQYSKGTK
jgi:hypothetical protein